MGAYNDLKTRNSLYFPTLETGSHQTASSANQSVHFAYILEKAETPHELWRSFRPQRTGESWQTPGSPDSASILSVRNKNGSLQRSESAPGGVRLTIAIPGDGQLHLDSRPPRFPIMNSTAYHPLQMRAQPISP